MRHRRPPRGAIAAIHPAVVLAAIAISFALGRQTGNAVVSLALGLFAALLTAITLVIVLTIAVDSRWPTLQDVLEDAFLVRWFLLAMVAVTLAAFSKASGASLETTLAITLSLAGALLGSFSLYRLLRLSTGTGRQRFLGRLLRDRVNQLATPTPSRGMAITDAAENALFAPFCARLQRAIDNRDVTALRDRVAELGIAGEGVPWQGAGALVALDLRVLRELGRAVILGRLDSPEIGSVLMPQLGALLIDHSARLLVDEPAAEGDAWRGSIGAQIQAATCLGQTARSFAWIVGAAHSEAVERERATPALRAIAAGAVATRAKIMDFVDHDPPRHPAPAHLGRHALSDPIALLAWWWCVCDLNGSHDGRAFYIAFEGLTGEKFSGSFGWGNRYLLSELDDRLRVAVACGEASLRASSKRALESLGGLRDIALDLLTTSLASWRDRRGAIPEGLEQNWTYWEDPLRLARRARLFLPRSGDPWLNGAEDALAALARLISRARAGSGLAALAQSCTDSLPMSSVPPIVEPQRRPAAAVLAVAVHLAPRDVRHSAAELERFLQRLPTGLLDGALLLAEAILHVGEGSDHALPSSSVSKLVSLLTFIQRDPQAEVA